MKHSVEAEPPEISVLLATFNGERYLGEQLDSLLEQTVGDCFEIVVRDDGSTDSTIEILESYRSAHPTRIRLVPFDVRLGAKFNFVRLLGEARGKYIAFCDQDDLWQPDKLAIQQRVIEDLERDHGAETPLLCCSDAAVTDAELRITCPSYFAKHRLSPVDGRDATLARLLFRNFAIGATVMMNRSLVAQCQCMPEDSIMHDWWAALVATCLGRVCVLPAALILYRQHGANAVGSRTRTMPTTLAAVIDALELSRRRTEACLRQADALRLALGTCLTTPQCEVLDRFFEFGRRRWWQRAATLVRTRAYKPGLLLNGVHLYACMTARP